jgi:hypothetical protein
MFSLSLIMEFENGILQFGAFFSVTLGIFVLFVGKRINDAVGFLREFSIPEPVTGGLICTLLIAVLFFSSGIEISFDLAARDVLLVYFFTTIAVRDLPVRRHSYHQPDPEIFSSHLRQGMAEPQTGHCPDY